MIRILVLFGANRSWIILVVNGFLYHLKSGLMLWRWTTSHLRRSLWPDHDRMTFESFLLLPRTKSETPKKDNEHVETLSSNLICQVSSNWKYKFHSRFQTHHSFKLYTPNNYSNLKFHWNSRNKPKKCFEVTFDAIKTFFGANMMLPNLQ